MDLPSLDGRLWWIVFEYTCKKVINYVIFLVNEICTGLGDKRQSDKM